MRGGGALYLQNQTNNSWHTIHIVSGFDKRIIAHVAGLSRPISHKSKKPLCKEVLVNKNSFLSGKKQRLYPVLIPEPIVVIRVVPGLLGKTMAIATVSMAGRLTILFLLQVGEVIFFQTFDHYTGKITPENRMGR